MRTPAKSAPARAGTVVLAAQLLCLTASAVLLVLTILGGLQLRNTLQQRSAAQAALAAASTAVKQAEVRHRSLAEEQERFRASYTAAQAMVMSLDVQAAQQQLDEARAERAKAEAISAELRLGYERSALLLVPRISALLLCLFASFMLNNRRLALREG